MNIQRTFLLFVLVFAAITADAAVRGNQHIIIVDVGNTSTQLFLYKYTKGNSATNTLPSVQLIKKTKVLPGIVNENSINNPISLTPYLEPLFNNINTSLTPAEKNITSMYFFATSQIRYLSTYQQRTLLSNISNSLVPIILGLNYNLPANISKNIRVISGAEEGLFNWLTINYLNKTLLKNPLTADNTYPVLVLGEESTEITFLPKDKPEHNTINFTFKNTEYTLYSYSYENFGIENALNRIIENNTLTANTDLAPCFPVNGQFPLKKPIITQGSGNFDQCSAFLQSYAFAKFKIQNCEFNNKTCSQLGVYQPPLTQSTWYGTRNYYHTLNILGLANMPITLEQIKQQGKKYCATSIEDLKKLHKEVPTNDLMTYCFNAAWISTLLTAYQFSNDHHFIAVDTINNTDTSWTLGSAIYLLTQ